MRSPATSPCRFTLFLAAAAALCWVPAAYAVAADARLVAPPGSETELKATLSAEVRALPVALHQPVTKGAILVEMDVTKLQKELEGERKNLAVLVLKARKR